MTAPIPVTLSTSSVYPLKVADGFETAARLGYDGLEVMVLADPSTQDAIVLRRLVEEHGLPVHSIHAPTLLLTQRVYGRVAWDKIDRSIELAQQVGAEVVVIHPPFRWQRDYASTFVTGIAEREDATGVRLAIENMYPWRAGNEWPMYLPGWNPVPLPYDNVTLDLSHAATAHDDVLEMQADLGDRLAHVHLADGSGSFKDEHRVPGHGMMPCAEFLRRLSRSGYAGVVAVEVGTRTMKPEARDAALRESLEFARTHLAEGAGTP